MKKIISRFLLGNTAIFYITDAENVGLVILPNGYEPNLEENPLRAVSPLVQLKLLGDAYPGAFGNGATMLNCETAKNMKMKDQQELHELNKTTIITNMEGPAVSAKHELIWQHGYDVLESKVTVVNTSQEIVQLEMLASFSLGMLSPLDQAYKPNKLRIHRLRGRWAQESNLESFWAEDLLLTPNSSGAVDVHSERFGQTGNKTSGLFSPFLAVEDVENNIIWGSQLLIDGSWQMEVFNYDETLSISGGLADYDFGHWMKNLAPEQSFESPSAYITVCNGDLDMLCDRLVSIQQMAVKSFPESEQTLPVMFNEWCSSWGYPTQDSIVAQVNALKGRSVEYFVIDAGWYKDKENQWFEMVGDWEPSKEKYPEGLKKIAEIIRDAGMIPGIWCEIETCGRLSRAFQLKDHLLTKFGKQIVSAGRKYWDFRDPWTVNYLTERVIDLLEYAGIGYIKIDSNENTGVGCDGAESLGEGLRQNLVCFEKFMLNMKNRLPHLVVENCSSGGQRVTPKMSAIFPMFSCSDSFECTSAPIAAANMQRVALPRQSQIWCTLRTEDDEKTLIYKLSTGFLGRMCLSGNIVSLSAEQNAIVDKAIAFYRKAADVISDGTSRRFGPKISSYTIPDGWQAMVREGAKTNETLIVCHTFDVGVPENVEIPLPDGDHELLWAFAPDMIDLKIDSGAIKFSGLNNNVGCVVMLKRKK